MLSIWKGVCAFNSARLILDSAMPNIFYADARPSLSHIAQLRDQSRIPGTAPGVLHQPRFVESGPAGAGDWRALAEMVEREIELNASAHTMAALRRRRGVASAFHLLCLSLMLGPGRLPLRLIAEQAQHAGIASLSEPALFRRLAQAEPWLNMIGRELLARRLTAAGDGLRAGANEAAAGFAFIMYFEPWPADVFTEEQMYVLLCVRAGLVAGQFGGVCAAPPAGHSGNPQQASVSALEGVRNMALLISAILLPELRAPSVRPLPARGPRRQSKLSSDE
jgi:hypothetical protein